jgi:hypothetical protein
VSGASRPVGGRTPLLPPAREDRLAVFLRGLVVGAFAGAILAGSVVLRRLVRR